MIFRKAKLWPEPVCHYLAISTSDWFSQTSTQLLRTVTVVLFANFALMLCIVCTAICDTTVMSPQGPGERHYNSTTVYLYMGRMTIKNSLTLLMSSRLMCCQIISLPKDGIHLTFKFGSSLSERANKPCSIKTSHPHCEVEKQLHFLVKLCPWALSEFKLCYALSISASF